MVQAGGFGGVYRFYTLDVGVRIALAVDSLLAVQSPIGRFPKARFTPPGRFFAWAAHGAEGEGTTVADEAERLRASKSMFFRTASGEKLMMIRSSATASAGPAMPK